MAQPVDVGSKLDVIEQQVRFLQLALWNSRERLWGSFAPSSPLGVLEPGVALKMKGYKIQTVDSLGEMNHHGKRIEVAGSIDRSSKIVSVSARFSKQEQLFTAAHELGHAVLHPNGDSVHRDRPMDPANWYKSPEEKEADGFAACFLMPEKQVRSVFRETFFVDRFVLNDDTAFALYAKSLDAVAQRLRTLRDLSMALARAITYVGRPMRSLVEIFRVSPTAMAIRLEQLDLVALPNFVR